MVDVGVNILLYIVTLKITSKANLKIKTLTYIKEKMSVHGHTLTYTQTV